MINLLDATEVFMDKAGQLNTVPLQDSWPMPTDGVDPDSRLRKMRQDLLAEEVSEWLDAENADDLTEVVDALLDIIVVSYGYLLALVGPDKAKLAAAEVVRSNLDKVIGPGLPIFREDGKVLKPEGWTPPNIAEALA